MDEDDFLEELQFQQQQRKKQKEHGNKSISAAAPEAPLPVEEPSMDLETGGNDPKMGPSASD